MNGKLEAILLHVIGLLKSDVQEYCDLETVEGGTTLVANDGSLASILRFNGTKSVMGRDQFERFISLLTTSLSVYFNGRGHQLQIVFRKDLDARMQLELNATQQRSTAAKLGLAVNDLIDENVEKYSQYVYDEECYMVFWSRPALLDSTESRMAQQETNQFRKETGWPSSRTAQNLLRPISYLLDRHVAYVSKMVDDLGSHEFGCSVELLDLAPALRAIKASVYPDYTSHEWAPSVPGTKIPFRWKKDADEKDMSELLYPTLPDQIMTASAEVGVKGKPNMADGTCVRIGSRWYAPMLLSHPPREPQYFNTLFNSLNRAETRENGDTRALPYSISFMLESDGMNGTGFKSLMASLLAITSERNRNINLALKELRERRRDGECIVKFRVAAMTWAGIDADSVKELALRKSKLWRTLEGWGNPTVYERTGNPMVAFQSNAVGLSYKHIGNPCPAPLPEALALLPLTRPASPFPTGSTIYRSLDGKVLRYQRFSSEQTTWITLLSGKPGSGKSVLMNNNHFESCLLPGLTRLPFIGIIDIGVSSSGFIDLVRDSLPEDMRHLAVYKRLQNAAFDCVNPMDTPLGLRKPLPKDREFLKNFLSILVTAPERSGKPYEGMSDFVGRMIDMAYLRKSDKLERASPVTYKPGHNKTVDEGVWKLGYPVMPATTYWELVDVFFKAGMIYEAEVAQRFAVPVLDDLVAVASDTEEVVPEYGDAKIEGGRHLLPTFITGIREAIANYPVFSSNTQFDIGPARVISLDLQDVAIEGGDSAKKQTALMYMIARQSFMKKVAYSKEDLPHFDPMYRAFYDRMINEIVEEVKVMAMDEYHMTKGQVGLVNQVMADGRTARKWNMELILASQLMEDFGELTKIATTKFILDAGNEETRKWLRSNIGLTEVEEQALTNYVHGPNAHGATFLAQFETKSAKCSQLFTMTPGPMRLWALSTTAEDRKLRGLLYEAMPRPAARKLLAHRFPNGSCKKYVERLKEETYKGVDFVDDDMQASVIERLAEELIHEFFNSSEYLNAA
ncbi:type IV secretion protein DotO [Xanthomonas oryzae]|uniref:type IV secretion protein DotO n=1 Tax=Xanthomonas oryzae TaxID=347 RepID=UPI003DA15E21